MTTCADPGGMKPEILPESRGPRSRAGLGSRRELVRSAEGSETLGHVGEAGFVTTDPIEQGARPRQVARAFLEVSERVPEPEVMLLHAFDRARRTPTQHGDRLVESIVVGQTAREHDATFGHEFGRGRHLSQFGPQFLHPAGLAEGPSAVHQHRVLIDLTGEFRVDVELFCRRLVLPGPIQRHTEEFTDRRRPRQRLTNRSQDADGIAFAILRKRF